MSARDEWEELQRRGPDSIQVHGAEVRSGSVVSLQPRRRGGDIFETALIGRTAVVQEVLEDYEGRVQVAVTLSDDPGRDLGALRRPGHRFFLDPEEVRPIDGCGASEAPPARVLVAGIGNVFLGDDGFGVALAGRLALRPLPVGVEVLDFGIRGMDLAYALRDGHDAVVLLDATPRGERPGTIYVIEPDLDCACVELDAHGMDPVKVIAFAQSLEAGQLPRILIVGCEPLTRMSAEDERLLVELSDPVQESLDRAVTVVEELLRELASDGGGEEPLRELAGEEAANRAGGTAAIDPRREQQERMERR